MKEKIFRIGLIGKDVSKSISGPVHRFLFPALGYACEYAQFSITPQELDSTVCTLLGDFDGFNVTIPYKRDIMEYLDEIRGDALTFSAVNTVVSRTRVGYNTDGLGFLLMCKTSGVEFAGKRVLVLGGGGSGRSSAVAIKNAGGDVYMYQRRREKLLETCAQLGIKAADDPNEGGYDVLVNCTGVGMHDKEGLSPVEERAFAGACAAVDLIYEPQESEFLRQAKTLGLKTVNGVSMLFYQAYYADCLFLGIEPNEEQAEKLFQRYINE